MKKSYLKSLSSLILVLFFSCSDYLETEPLDFTSIDNFYKTAGDAETALTGCYGRMRESYSVDEKTGLFLIGNVGTDELIGNPFSTPDAQSSMDQFQFGSVTKDNLNIRDIWAKMYNSLYGLNLLLSKIDAIEMDENRKTEIKAEVRFLRGWHYQYLGMIFGGVPVFDDVPHDFTQGRNSLEEVMNQAISDLQFAYDNLTDEAILDSGRATKWAAAGYLAKLYAYLASCKKYNVGQSLNFPLNSFEWVDTDAFYQKVNNLSDAIINQSGLILTDNYQTLFIEGSKDKQNQEFLFSYLASPGKMSGFGLMHFGIPVGHLGGGWGTNRPTQEVLSRYNRTYDLRAKIVVGGLGTQDVTEIIDGNSYYKPTDLSLDANGITNSGDYCVNKFRYLKTPSKHDDVYYGNYPLLRLADIYLLKAEAVAHINSDDAGREILKTIRSRALNDPSDIDILQNLYYKPDFIEELLDERSRELCFEQQRKFDLVRFNRYASTIRSISTTVGVWNGIAASPLVDNITDYQIWSPIPEEDEISNPNLVPNNPGY